MSEDDHDRRNEYKGRWKEDPYTHHLLAKERALEKMAVELLIGKCAQTTDPDVARCHAVIVARRAAIRLLESGDT